MTKPLIVENEIVINASTEKVWEVLTNPEYITQWDDIPEGYDMNANLKIGSELRWEIGSGHFTTLTVTEYKPCTYLKLSLFNSMWEVSNEKNDIAYSYSVTQLDEQTTKVNVSIGDFISLQEGKKYYDASIEFATDALSSIKQLSEQ
jgi:uncharacterized protein YndB with AHSA1/START domain